MELEMSRFASPMEIGISSPPPPLPATTVFSRNFSSSGLQDDRTELFVVLKLFADGYLGSLCFWNFVFLMPLLDEWSILEWDYSVSLSEAIQALVKASLQLPIGGNIRVDMKEVNEALNLATKMMEIIIFNVQRLMPKAKEMDNLDSKLARMSSEERTRAEECGYLFV